MNILLDPHIEPLWEQMLSEDDENLEDVVSMVWFYNLFAREGLVGITRAVEEHEKCIIWHELEDRTLYCLKSSGRLWSFFSTYRSSTSTELVVHVHEVFGPDQLEDFEADLWSRLGRKANP